MGNLLESRTASLLNSNTFTIYIINFSFWISCFEQGSETQTHMSALLERKAFQGPFYTDSGGLKHSRELRFSKNIDRKK